MSAVVIVIFFAVTLIDWPGFQAMRLRGPRGLLRAADEEQQR